MKKRMQIYKCEQCGLVLELLVTAKGNPFCCGKPMKLLEAKTEGKSPEKHIPLIEKTDNGYKVTVGKDEHPMDVAHFIRWIELIINNGDSHTVFTNSGDKAQANFCVELENLPNDCEIEARAYCSIHGLWKSD